MPFQMVHPWSRNLVCALVILTTLSHILSTVVTGGLKIILGLRYDSTCLVHGKYSVPLDVTRVRWLGSYIRRI